MKRSPLKPRRHGLRRRGARAEREAEALEVFRTLVLARAQHRCERCRQIPDPVWMSPYDPRHLHAHHRLPRARGGKHELTNGACLCFGCHAAVHDHTAPDYAAWLIEAKPKRK